MNQYLRIAYFIILLGIFGPLFGVSHEDRSKDILNASFTSPPPETPQQDSACAATYRHYERGIASWYGPGFHGRQMANGEAYDMYRYTVAHKTLRLGTEVCVTNRANGRSVKATVTDRGPYVAPRVIDLSKRVADELGITAHGVGRVDIALHPRAKNA